MGKRQPSAPPPPDPNVVATAQTASNKETAIANANLNRIDQYTPYGNQIYTTNGTNSDGTPRYTQTTTLSPEQQALFNSDNNISQGMANLGQSQIKNVQDVINNPLNFSGLQKVQQGDLQSSAGPVPNLETFIPGVGDVRSGLDTSRVGDYQRNVNADSLQNGAMYGQIQDQIDDSRVPSLVGGDDLYGTYKTAQDAAYNQDASRLNPQWDKRQHDLENQLIQQGITQNSDAWNNASGELGRQRNDAYQTARNSAVGIGNAAQAQLYGQGLSSNQNAFDQALKKGSFHNEAQQQGFGQRFSNARLSNEAQQQKFTQGLANATLNNSAANDEMERAKSNFAAENSAQQQTFGQMLDRTNFKNNAVTNTFGMGLANANLNNQVAGQGYAQSTGARNQGINEILQQQQNPLNVLRQLRTGAQATSPTFGGVPLTNVAGTDTQTPVYNAYNGQIADRNAQIQSNNNMTSGLFNMGASAIAF